jgi:hypothetical protein
VLDYLSQHPTAADILAAVYEVKPKKGSGGAIRPPKVHIPEQRAVPESEFIAGMSMASSFLGQANPLTEDIKASIDFANELKKKMKIN